MALLNGVNSAHRGDNTFEPAGIFVWVLWRGLGLRLLRARGFAVHCRRQQQHSEHSPMFHFRSPSSLCKILPGCLQGSYFTAIFLLQMLRARLRRALLSPVKNSPCARRTRKHFTAL